MVKQDFVIPGRKKIGGDLLKLNYQNCQKMNRAQLLASAPMFGLSFLGDGATIHKMPLINVLAMSANVPPVTVCINDCTDHLQGGGKKDAPYIANLFENNMSEFDNQKTLVDLLYFDGASNVQKAGDILTAKYPRAYCLHGGEHVVSLFFSDVAKLAPVKVRHV